MKDVCPALFCLNRKRTHEPTMSEENRKTVDLIFESLNFGTVTPQMRIVIMKAIDEAERRGAEKMRERNVEILQERFDSENRMASEHKGNMQWQSIAAADALRDSIDAIRTLPLEGPKDGRE
jgi:hypothetical protein